MKFAFIASTLALLPASAAFAAPANSRAALRTASSLHGWFSDLFDDRIDTVEEEIIATAERFQNTITNDIKGTFKAPTPAQERENEMNMLTESNFKHMPTKAQTGVEEHITRFAATLSQQTYDLYNGVIPKIAMSTDQHEVEVIVEGQSLFKPTNPTFAAVVCGDTMILGWRGTQNIADGINDFAFSPCGNMAIRKHAKNVKMHGGMASLCSNDIVTHEETLIAECKKRGIKEIVTTGHSLGGGIGQIGHTILRAQIQDPNSPWSELKDVNVRSVVFCAPMTTVIVKDGCSDETSKFIEEIDQNSCVVVYQNDLVPRGYGYLSFINDFVDDAIPYIGPYLMDGKRMPSYFIKKGIEKLAEFAEEQVLDAEAFQGIVSVLSNYVHPGKICFYKDEFAKPITLVDKGAFDKNSGKKGTFRSVKYEPVKKKDQNPIEGASLCHGAPRIGIMYDEELLH